MTSQPVVYEIDTRPHLQALGAVLGRPATLADISDSFLKQIAGKGIQFLWLMGVWQLGKQGRSISLEHPDWRADYLKALPDLKDSDISGSPYAIADYQVDQLLGGNQALALLRSRMKTHGLKLCLDFVPNHTALDHTWVFNHPEYYIHGTPEDLASQPGNFKLISCHDGDHILAHGKDPNYPGWPDTLQLNYFNKSLVRQITTTLLHISSQCDAIRCDMAMLVLPAIFASTWQLHYRLHNTNPSSDPFWKQAIAQVKEAHEGFVFIAESYWDLEWALQQDGFDFTYDKKLYDRLTLGCGSDIRAHLRADWDYNRKLTRFLENHDEPRVASLLDWPRHQCCAIISFFAPGMLLVHEGQLDGNLVRSNVHLNRRLLESPDPKVQAFYSQLLSLMAAEDIRESLWQLLTPSEAWAGNFTHQDFIVILRSSTQTGTHLCIVNFSPHQSQCLVPLPKDTIPEAEIRLVDLFSKTEFIRSGIDLQSSGLFVDLPGWGYHWMHFQPLQAETKSP